MCVRVCVMAHSSLLTSNFFIIFLHWTLMQLVFATISSHTYRPQSPAATFNLSSCVFKRIKKINLSESETGFHRRITCSSFFYSSMKSKIESHSLSLRWIGLVRLSLTIVTQRMVKDWRWLHCTCRRKFVSLRVFIHCHGAMIQLNTGSSFFCVIWFTVDVQLLCICGDDRETMHCVFC